MRRKPHGQRRELPKGEFFGQLSVAQWKSAPLDRSEGKAKLGETGECRSASVRPSSPKVDLAPGFAIESLAEKSGGLHIALDAARAFDEARYFCIGRKLIWIVIATKIFREFFWVVAVRP